MSTSADIYAALGRRDLAALLRFAEEAFGIAVEEATAALAKEYEVLEASLCKRCRDKHNAQLEQKAEKS